MTKKGFFKKYEYVYDEKLDIYICPNNKDLKYTTTNKSGYREYKSNPKDCEGCPFLEQCTQSKNHQKVITRHVWEEYRELADEIRYTPEWKDIYPLRKETIERVYADCKEKHGLRFTRIRGLKKNQQESLIIFGCHNLGKLARMKKRRGLINTTSPNKKERHIRKIVQICQFAKKIKRSGRFNKKFYHFVNSLEPAYAGFSFSLLFIFMFTFLI